VIVSLDPNELASRVRSVETNQPTNIAACQPRTSTDTLTRVERACAEFLTHGRNITFTAVAEHGC
jgi:predicted phosphoribosyltransferase